MHFRIQLVVSEDDGTEHAQEIADLTRTEASIETLGLLLTESKQVLQTLQCAIIAHQVAAHLAQQRACPHGGKMYRLKDSATAPFRTLFGLVTVPNPRWRQCPCQPHTEKTFRPLAALLPTRTSPELLYLETKWAALASYGLTLKTLRDVLPLDRTHSAVTVRNHTLQVARRREQMLGPEKPMFVESCQAERDRLPLPDGPFSVGLDGAIVRARRGTTGEKAAALFEVIAGKSILAFRRDDPEEVPPSSKCFALVRSVDPKPKRRLFELLRSQGLQDNQQVTFFSDGGDTVRTLPAYLHPEAEHILDWFYITMTITVLQQYARGLVRDAVSPGVDERPLTRRLESVKHDLWHGNTTQALAGLEDLADDLDNWEYDEEGDPHPHKRDGEAAKRMLTYVRELVTYITNNTSSVVNYGERHRNRGRLTKRRIKYVKRLAESITPLFLTIDHQG